MIKRVFGKYGLYFAWVVSIVATGGSLYLSEVLGLIPCELCWYQRIFMYPLVILLGMATFRDDRNLIPYIYPLTIIGASISTYHILKQKIPALADFGCQAGVPCSQDQLNLFGFITIPMLALTAFLLILLFLVLFRRFHSETEK
jgi:disulfide bond formation protein DsbB